MVLNKSLMRKRTKDEQFIFSKRAQNGQNRAVLEMGCNGWNFLVLEREREPLLSRIVADRTVGFDRVRRKVVLRGEGYAWTPIWWSSDNSKR